MIAAIATNGFHFSTLPASIKSGVMYSLPINATPDKEAALEISIIALIPNASEG